MKHQQAKSQRNRQHPTMEAALMQMLLIITAPRKVTIVVQDILATQAADSTTTTSKATTNKVLMVTETNGAVMDRLIKYSLHSYLFKFYSFVF